MAKRSMSPLDTALDDETAELFGDGHDLEQRCTAPIAEFANTTLHTDRDPHLRRDLLQEQVVGAELRRTLT